MNPSPVLSSVMFAGARWCTAGLLAAIPWSDSHPQNVADDLVDVAQLDAQPVPVKSVNSIYPDELKVDHIEGLALTEYVIETDGHVTNARCLATNDPRFGESAAVALRRSRFLPCLCQGRPVRAHVQMQHEFHLTSRKDSMPLRLSLPPDYRDDRALPREVEVGAAPAAAFRPPGAVYPYEALRAGLRGRARIQFSLNPDGSVQSLAVLDASSPEFALAAEARLAGTWFVPKSRDYGPFVADFDFRPDGGGDAQVSDSAMNLLNLLEHHPEEIVTSKLDAKPRPLRTFAPMLFPHQPPEGEAVVEVLIDRYGYVQLPRVVSCTAPEIGAAATQAAFKWLFVPA